MEYYFKYTNIRKKNKAIKKHTNIISKKFKQ